MSILLLLGILIILFISIFILYSIYDKLGLIMLMIFTFLLTIINFFKNIKIFNIDFSLSIIPYVTFISLIYIFIDKYKVKWQKRDIKLFLIIIILLLLYPLIFLFYEHSINDNVTSNINYLLETNYLTFIFFPIVIFLSIIISCKLYKYFKKYNNVLFINISLVTIIVGIFDTILFTILRYIGILTFSESLKLGLGNYLAKIIISIIYIPMISYIIKRKKVKK